MNPATLYSDDLDAKPLVYHFANADNEDWHIVYPDPESWTPHQRELYIAEYWSDIRYSTNLSQREYTARVNDGEAYLLEDYLLGDPDRFHPLMDYLYPVHSRYDPAESAALLHTGHVNLTYVYIETHNDHFMALTGAGMDFSWDICRGYMLLGQLPPVHFCDLPDMGPTTYDHHVVNACMRSLDISLRRINHDLLDLTTLKDRYAAQQDDE